MGQVILVRKGSGEMEPFDPEKVRSAALRAGADPELVEKVVANVRNRVRNGVSTHEIYKIVFSLLKKEDEASASRFGLKHALFKLGPAGFTFETFFAEVLREHDYKTELRKVLQGAAINHEIDIVAEDKSGRYMIECKYHNVIGLRCRAPDVLYTYARFLDLLEGAESGKCPKFDAPWLVTNTKFSSDVIAYANHKKIRLTGWGFPSERSLQHLIESRLLYPVTILNSLDKFAKTRLAEANLMMVKDLLSHSEKELLQITGIPRNRMNSILTEANAIAPMEVLEKMHPEVHG